MGRKRRIHIPNAFVHVSQECHNSAMNLINDEDKGMYLSALELVAVDMDYDIISFCLEDNHIHTILETPSLIEGHTLSAFMHRVNTIFGHQFNHRHNRTGTMWNGRYHAGGWLSHTQLLVLEMLLWYVESHTARRCVKPAATRFWKWCSGYYLLNRRPLPVATKLRGYVEMIYGQRGCRDPVAEFGRLVEQVRPDWRRRVSSRRLLWLSREENEAVAHDLNGIAARLKDQRIRSWKLEVEHYSMLVQPMLRLAV